MTGDDYIRLRCIASFETFVRHFFAHQYGRKFIVSQHHRQIIDALTEVVAGRCPRLIINMPPRYGKTELAVKMFMAYGLALNPQAHFVHLSYSDDLARDNSETVRSLLMTDEWRRIFPYIRLSKSSCSKKKWMTEDGGGVYATSTGGQITGFGAGVVDEDAELEDEVKGVSERSVFGGAIIIDDPMKPEDALSDTRRERINQRFETTIRSRVNSRSTPIVIIMQRLHRNDLAGYLLESEPSEWRVLSLPAITQEQGHDAPLWEFKHNLQELYRLREINRYVFETQYMQNPMPLEGLLYEAGRWREYQVPPIGRRLRRCMVDTADTGSDYLCAICYDETEQGAYVTDVLFTQESMDTTEDMLARMLVAHGTEQCDIESNNGGRGFARNVERKVRLLGDARCTFVSFSQTANKETRLLTRASEVQNLTYFPAGWRERWPHFAGQLDGMMKAGRNAHDDAADCLTMTAERRGEFGWHTYTEAPAGGVRVAEIELQEHGVVWWCVVQRVDDVVYLIDGGTGEELPDLDGAVQVETCQSEIARARAYRERHPDTWLRAQRTNPAGHIAQWWAVARKVLLPTDTDTPFVANLLAYDGTQTAGAVACLCAAVERLSRAQIA